MSLRLNKLLVGMACALVVLLAALSLWDITIAFHPNSESGRAVSEMEQWLFWRLFAVRVLVIVGVLVATYVAVLIWRFQRSDR